MKHFTVGGCLNIGLLIEIVEITTNTTYCYIFMRINRSAIISESMARYYRNARISSLLFVAWEY